METAVNVAQSCGHIPNNSTKVQLVDISTSNSLMEQLAICNNTINIKADRKQLTLIVDGQSLALILGRKHLEVQFAEMSLKCEAVICCRLSPLQKAQVCCKLKYIKQIYRPLSIKNNI